MERGEVSADVPGNKIKEYLHNYYSVTHGTGRLVLFAGDQRVEHLTRDFVGEGIASDDADPEHMFRIASKAKIGAFAPQLGLIAKYGHDYPYINYIPKINSKTNLTNKTKPEQFSSLWYSVKQVAEFKKNSGLNIMGVGYTIYLGSEYEAEMLRTAAKVVYEAHQEGLLTILYIYPRGKAVKDQLDSKVIAGATGVANCLGSDFVKVNYPRDGNIDECIASAGRTGVIFAGGSKKKERDLLELIKKQIDAGAIGNATGRNIHQRTLNEAVKFTNAIFSVTVENNTVERAFSENLG